MLRPQQHAARQRCGQPRAAWGARTRGGQRTALRSFLISVRLFRFKPRWKLWREGSQRVGGWHVPAAPSPQARLATPVACSAPAGSAQAQTLGLGPQGLPPAGPAAPWRCAAYRRRARAWNSCTSSSGFKSSSWSRSTPRYVNLRKERDFFGSSAASAWRGSQRCVRAQPRGGGTGAGE
jgi:hypothetical protein